MKKVKQFRAKGANKKKGKPVDKSRLVDKKGFSRGKNETEPERKFTRQECKPKNPETVREFVDMLDQKKNEDIGVY